MRLLGVGLSTSVVTSKPGPSSLFARFLQGTASAQQPTSSCMRTRAAYCNTAERKIVLIHGRNGSVKIKELLTYTLMKFLQDAEVLSMERYSCVKQMVIFMAMLALA
ncbi:hypothetical protein QJQ45_028872, partial [Haematococcus lacustris]